MKMEVELDGTNLVIRKEEASGFDKIYDYYIKDFPEEERKPYKKVYEGIKNNTYDLLVMYEEDRIIGYSILIKLSSFNFLFIDFFAILEDYRKKGYGNIFMTNISRIYEEYKGIFLEIDAIGKGDTEEENEIRKRRYYFYEKLGYELLENIEVNLFGVDYNILFLNFHKEESHTDREFSIYLYDIYSRFISKNMINEKLKIKILQPKV